jgi:hypothetical protein
MSWGQALKEAAILLAKEIERHSAAQATTACAICGCTRDKHCACGEHCNGKTCTGCMGFAAKPTTTENT